MESAKPKDLVKSIRQTIELKGDALKPVLVDAVNVATNGLATQRPYCTHINRLCGITKAERIPANAIARGLDPDPLNGYVVAYKFRAYPSINSDLSKFEEWTASAKKFWCAAMRQIRYAVQQREFERLNNLRLKPVVSEYLAKFSGDMPKSVCEDVIQRFIRATQGVKNGAITDVNSDRFTLLIKFGSSGVAGRLDKIGSYCEVGHPYDPANHSGPRPGKYRSFRELRPVRLRLNSSMPWFEFDVLFHRPVTGCPKSASITKDGKRWFIAFSAEITLPDNVNGNDRRFVGMDWRWRKNGGDLAVVNFGGGGYPVKELSVDFKPNRRARRCESGKSKDAVDLPAFNPTPEGRKTFQKAMDARKDAIKERLCLPKTYGWNGIKKILKDATRSPEDLTWLNGECAWHERAKDRFAYMCRVEVENRLRQMRLIAASVLAYCKEHGITDVGSAHDQIKDMAEEDIPEDATDRERRIAKLREENRQIAAPGKLRSVIEHTLVKNGIRVHRINVWKTSQRCVCGHDTKSIERSWLCENCGTTVDRSVVAVNHLAVLARECSGGDAHPRCCSKDGNGNPYHGLPGCAEAMELIKKAKAAKKARRSKTGVQVATAEVV